MLMRRALCIAGMMAGWTLAVPCAVAQTQNSTTAPTAFEVVAIHHPPPTRQLSTLTRLGGKELREEGISLALLMQIAFGIENYQLTTPDGTTSDSFDLTAKTGSDLSLSKEQMQLLVQKILIDRFKLTYHRETKPFKGYELVAAKGGPKLKATGDNARGPYIMQNELHAASASMKTLAAMLAAVTHEPVTDKTGVAGTYAIDLKFDPQQGGGTEDSALPSLFTALQEQTGLQLKPAEVPVEMLVVDHIEKEPTEN